MQLESLQTTLANLPVPTIQYFDSIGSTNDAAMQWATAGAPEGALVLADTQTSGRGRTGRRWVTQPGTALAFSLVLHPTLAERAQMGLFSPLAALALVETLHTHYGLQTAQIKWPNDVLIQRRKTAGILVEAAWVDQIAQAVIIGVGVNVASSAVPPADQVRFPATSLEEQLGFTPDRETLLAQVLTALFHWRPQLTEAAFRQAWQHHLAFRGEQIRLQEEGEQDLLGELLGINEQGNLRLRLQSGQERSVIVGDIHLRLAD